MAAQQAQARLHEVGPVAGDPQRVSPVRLLQAQDALQVAAGESHVAGDLDAGEAVFREPEIQFVDGAGRAAGQQHDDRRRAPDAIEELPLPDEVPQEFSLPAHPATC